MKYLLMSALMLIVTAMAITTFTPAAVSAVGTPTENYTIPDLPTNDPSHEEIKPSVNFYLKGPTVQTKTSPAAFITGFTGTLEQNKYTVVGDGQWRLDVDINTPGWLYIYEYYPPNNNPSGRWLAYKWQLKQSGAWDIGPFTARSNEPEGQHVYRLWFYGNGQWATDNTSNLQNSLIYWEYLKNLPELKIQSFNASSHEVKPGETITLSWNVQGAESLEIPMIGPVTDASGTQTVALDKTTDFVLIATGLDGRQVSSNTITVTVSPVIPTTTPSMIMSCVIFPKADGVPANESESRLRFAMVVFEEKSTVGVGVVIASNFSFTQLLKNTEPNRMDRRVIVLLILFISLYIYC